MHCESVVDWIPVISFGEVKDHVVITDIVIKIRPLPFEYNSILFVDF